MDTGEVVSVVVGITSVLVTILLGGFAVWQAREYARDGRHSAGRMEGVQREIATATAVLDANVKTLGEILGNQVDRLTQHLTDQSPPLMDILRLLKDFPTQEPLPSDRATKADVEQVQALVSIARYAGSLNIFVHRFWLDLDTKGAATAGYVNPIMRDSYDTFTETLERLDTFKAKIIDEANAGPMIAAFKNNYIPHVKEQVEPDAVGALGSIAPPGHQP